MIQLLFIALTMSSCIPSQSYLAHRKATKEYRKGKISREEFEDRVDKYSRIPKSQFYMHPDLETNGAYICIYPALDRPCIQDCPKEFNIQEDWDEFEREGKSNLLFQYVLKKYKENGFTETRVFYSLRNDVFTRPEFSGKIIKNPDRMFRKFTTLNNKIIEEDRYLDHIFLMVNHYLLTYQISEDRKEIFSSNEICPHDPKIVFLPGTDIIKSTAK